MSYLTGYTYATDHWHSMENFFMHLAEDPLLYMGYALSAVGAAGILLFVAGFSGTIKHLFTYSEGADHVEHARTRTLWGLYLCMVSFGVWQCLRVFVGQAPVSTLLLAVILFSPVWAPWLKGLLFKSDSH